MPAWTTQNRDEVCFGFFKVRASVLENEWSAASFALSLTDAPKVLSTFVKTWCCSINFSRCLFVLWLHMHMKFKQWCDLNLYADSEAASCRKLKCVSNFNTFYVYSCIDQMLGAPPAPIRGFFCGNNTSGLSWKHRSVTVWWQVWIVKTRKNVGGHACFVFWHCRKHCAVVVKWGNPLELLQRSLKPLWLAMPSSKAACLRNWSPSWKKGKSVPPPTIQTHKHVCLFNAA